MSIIVIIIECNPNTKALKSLNYIAKDNIRLVKSDKIIAKKVII